MIGYSLKTVGENAVFPIEDTSFWKENRNSIYISGIKLFSYTDENQLDEYKKIPFHGIPGVFVESKTGVFFGKKYLLSLGGGSIELIGIGDLAGDGLVRILWYDTNLHGIDHEYRAKDECGFFLHENI